MTAKQSTPPVTLEALHEILELRRVYFLETSSRRWDPAQDGTEEPPGETKPSMHVMQQIGQRKISVRGRMTIDTPEGRLIADTVAVFVVKKDYGINNEELVLDEELVKEFTEKVGVPCIYPFVREAIYDGARKIGIKAPILGMLWAGNVSLEKIADLDGF